MSKRRTAIVCGKLCTAPEGDYYVTCSFDPNHIILRSRMPYHIVKCVKQHPGHNKLKCPYDATEYIDPEDYTNHILNCESRRFTDQEKYETAALKKKGLLCNIKQTPFFHDSIPAQEEDWGGRENDESNIDTSKEEEESLSSDDEVSFDNLEGVGRGTSFNVRGKTTEPKKGLGRAETLKRIIELKQRESLLKFPTSLSERRESLLKDVIKEEDLSGPANGETALDPTQEEEESSDSDDGVTFDNLVGVGRGFSSNYSKNLTTNGKGRAGLLRRITELKKRNESLSSSFRSQKEVRECPLKDVTRGQFDDT